jgi:hypothetical protein
MNFRSIVHTASQIIDAPVHVEFLAQYAEHCVAVESSQQNELVCVLNLQSDGFAWPAGQVHSSAYAVPQMLLLTVSGCRSQSANDGSVPDVGAEPSTDPPPSTRAAWPPDPEEQALARTLVISMPTTADAGATAIRAKWAVRSLTSELGRFDILM